MHPSASSCFLLFLYFRFSEYLKCPINSRKIREKNQRVGSFRNHQVGARGDPPGPQAPWWRGPWVGRARGAPGSLVDPLASPLRIYITIAPKTLGAEPFFLIPSVFRHRRRFKIGAVRRPCPGTLPEGGSTSGSFSIVMDDSWMTRE